MSTADGGTEVPYPKLYSPTTYNDFQHDFALMTDEADIIVLAELQVALFRECNNQ